MCYRYRRSLTISVGGEPISRKPTHLANQFDGHPQPGARRRCPRCGLQVAARPRVCRNCNARFA